MIELTRLRHDDVFFLNPDLIERIDCHVDTVVRLTNGSEYLVSESGAQIIGRIAEFRAKVLALVPVVTLDLPGSDADRTAATSDGPHRGGRHHDGPHQGAAAHRDAGMVNAGGAVARGTDR